MEIALLVVLLAILGAQAFIYMQCRGWAKALGASLSNVLIRLSPKIAEEIQRCNHCGRANVECQECPHGFICDNCRSVGKN